jgi:hypothetical protein
MIQCPNSNLHLFERPPLVGKTFYFQKCAGGDLVHISIRLKRLKCFEKPLIFCPTPGDAI